MSFRRRVATTSESHLTDIAHLLFRSASYLAHTFKAFTPRFIVQFKPDTRSSIYASYSRGNRAGAFNSVYYAQNDFVKAQIDAAAPVQGIVPEEKL